MRSGSNKVLISFASLEQEYRLLLEFQISEGLRYLEQLAISHQFQGVWTLQAKGAARKAAKTSILRAIPTMTHMSLVALQEAGFCKYLVSQNVDGLHRKSGIDPRKVQI